MKLREVFSPWVRGLSLNRFAQERYAGFLLFCAILASFFAVYTLLHNLQEIREGLFTDKEITDDFKNRILILAAALGVPFFLLRAWIAERQTRASEQKNIIDHLVKAIEQLGATRERKYVEEGKQLSETVPNLEVRLGAIYALERISQESERDHIQIMEILCAYIRENAPASSVKSFEEEANLSLIRSKTNVIFIRENVEKIQAWVKNLPPPRTDIQAVLDVIGRRSSQRISLEKRKKYRLDLRNVRLRKADFRSGIYDSVFLQDSYLEGSNLWKAHFNKSDLRKAHLESSNLMEASLDGADMESAHLEGSILIDIYLRNSNLKGAFLQMSYLGSAHLEGSSLSRSHLEGANMISAHLENSSLMNSYLIGSYLKGAHLEKASFKNANLEGACLKGAHLEGTFFTGSNLEKVEFSFEDGSASADLSKTYNITQAQLDSACGSWDVKLPPGLKHPEHWTKKPSDPEGGA